MFNKVFIFLFLCGLFIKDVSTTIQNILDSFCLKTDEHLSFSELHGKPEDISRQFKHKISPFSGCSSGHYPPDRHKLESYIINLDAPPRKRWTELIMDKSNLLLRLQSYMGDLLNRLFGKRIFNFITSHLYKIAQTLPSPYKEEIQGIADVSGVNLSDVVLYNIFYEVFTVCTSIIAENDRGEIIHGRNLDFGLLSGWDRHNKSWTLTELLRPLTVQLQFQRNGHKLFEGVSYAGFVGILTGVKQGNFSFSLNERFALIGGYAGLLEWILLKDYSQKWVSFLGREVLEKARSFQEAKVWLSRSRLLAPVYFILAGARPGEGALITRWRNSFNILELGIGAGSLGRQPYPPWFLVETNYDHWTSPPFYDDRRTPAVVCLERAGKNNVTFELLYDVLSTKPILNKLTTFTSLMSAKYGKIDSWVRDCPNPCWPW